VDENFLVEFTKIRFFPKVNAAILDFNGIIFQASMDNVTYENIFELDPNIRTGEISKKK
jgi:hypothetical protein